MLDGTKRLTVLLMSSPRVLYTLNRHTFSSRALAHLQQEPNGDDGASVLRSIAGCSALILRIPQPSLDNWVLLHSLHEDGECIAGSFFLQGSVTSRSNWIAFAYLGQLMRMQAGPDNFLQEFETIHNNRPRKGVSK